ncbi:hypothetical protein RCL1_007580 [Eukaryota sp. TZLM3-RCL]
MQTLGLNTIDVTTGPLFCKKRVDLLSKEETSLLTSLNHPSLVGYYHTFELETNEIIFDYCQVGLFSEFDSSIHILDAHDLWSIRNQILQALKYLASYGLYHKGLNVSNVLVCSLHPIKVKLSLFSNSRVLIGPVNTDIPIQEFWKKKMSEQEEVCFDDLIRSIVKSVFPYSIMDKNIVFTNPNTLEQNDLASLKALICSIESETMFKSEPELNKFQFSSPCRNFSHIILPYSLLHCVFTQVFKSRKRLMDFIVESNSFECFNKQFSQLSTKFCHVSSLFRQVFVHAFDVYCATSKDHLLYGLYNDFESSNVVLATYCSNFSTLLAPSTLLSVWLKKFPVTTITTSTLNLSVGIVDVEMVKKLELEFIEEEWDDLSDHSSIEPLSAAVGQNISLVTSCCNLQTISIKESSFSNISWLYLQNQISGFSFQFNHITDFSPLSSLTLLTNLSVNHCHFNNLKVISSLEKLSSLSLEHNSITDISPLSLLKVLRVLSLGTNRITDISPLFSMKQLRTLTLDDNPIQNISVLSLLTKLSELSLNRTNVSDIGPLSNLVQLTRLSLRKTAISDISPLRILVNLSYLDLRGIVSSHFPQKLLTSMGSVQSLLVSLRCRETDSPVDLTE